MYGKVLIALENTHCDATILGHIEPLLRTFNSEAILVHVADGFAARHFDALKLAESAEIKADRDYIERIASEFQERGIPARAVLRMGDPAKEIVKAAHEEGAELVAMSTHGHRLLGDVWHGTTVDKVRHDLDIPLLLLKAKKQP